MRRSAGTSAGAGIHNGRNGRMDESGLRGVHPVRPHGQGHRLRLQALAATAPLRRERYLPDRQQRCGAQPAPDGDGPQELPLQQERQRRRRQRHLLHPPLELRHRRRQPAGMAHPCAQQPARRHPTRPSNCYHTTTKNLTNNPREIFFRRNHPAYFGCLQ